MEERERIISESPLQSNLDSRSQFNLNDAYLALPRYQAEFKKNFGHFFAERELKALEKQESDTYSKLWALWHELVEHPNRRLQDPGREANSRADKVIPQVKRQIKNGFRKLAKESVNARLLPIDLLWDEQQVLWITIDSEPLRIYEDLPKVLETLQNSVGALEYGSLEKVLLEQQFEQICVLPLVDGKLIAKAARKISISSFFGVNAFEGQDWWNQAFYPLTENMLRAIGLEVWDNSRLEIVRRLASLIGNLYILVAHLSDLNRFKVDLPDESDQKSIEVVRPYFEQRMNLINNVLQAAIDTEVDLFSFYEEAMGQHPFLVESFPILKALHANVLPQSEAESEERFLRLSEMPEWLKRLEEATRQSEVIYLAWLEYIRQGSD